jgi:hypothetical protein
MIIYKKNELIITTGERSVNNFQSGLIRVDQKYVGLSTNEASDRTLLREGIILPNQLDDPSLDGLFIYGGAQESRTGDGFTTYQTSAYGRNRTTMVELSRSQKTILVSNLLVIVFDMIGTIVKKRGEVIELNEFDFDGSGNFDDSFLMPQGVRYVNYPEIQLISIAETNVSNFKVPTRTYEAKFDTTGTRSQKTFKLKDPSVNITAQRNFGKWVEYEFEFVREGDIYIEEV